MKTTPKIGTAVADVESAIQRSANRRTFLKGSALALGTLAGGSLLAGCGDSPKAAPKVPSAATLIKPNKKVELNVWTWAWPAEPQASEFTKAFEAAVPEVKLNIKMFPFPDYVTALRTAVPNGTAGDVLCVTTGSMIRQFASHLEPLDGLAAQYYGSNWRDDFIGGSVEEVLASAPKGAGLLAMPQQYSVGGVMWLNQPVLDKVGGQVPKSYDEYLALSKELRAKGLVGSIWGAKDNWPNTDYLVQFSSQFKRGIVAAAEAGDASFTDDAIVAALNFMKRTLDDDLWNKAPFATTAFPDAYNLFFDGKAATASLGTWATGALSVGKRMDEYSAFLWPKLPDAPENDWLKASPGIAIDSGLSPVRPWRTVNVAAGMLRGLDPDKRYAAWKFIEYWCGPEGQQKGASVWTPARKGLRPDGLNKKWTEIYDWQTSLAGEAEKREFDFSETRAALETAIAAVCVNGSDPKTELARVDVATNRARHPA